MQPEIRVPEISLTATTKGATFEIEKVSLTTDATGVTRQGAAGTDHSMARNDDRKRITAVGEPYRAEG